MSGGVDSSVAAALLRDQGHDVTGVTLRLWGGDADAGCCSVADVEDARRVAAQLGLPHYVFDFADDFDASVVSPFVAAYVAGHTPNPCVDCNNTMKWGRLLDRALAIGFDAIATGHHARVETMHGALELRRGADAAKDQSYVLARLGPPQLARTLLPVGELTKADVRAHATRLGLRTAAKAESMDVCFVKRGERRSFVAGRAEERPGVMVTTNGQVVGEHTGVSAFTIGQRRGLGVALGERRFVVDVDADAATVTIGRHDDLLCDSQPLRDLRVLGGELAPGSEVLAQVRAHGEALPARWEGGCVAWHRPQPRVAPGQVVALYRDDVVLGGALAA
ncbi:MAG: tRNA 2-thiouridine(34) synthase MnmA [Actinobacteria bacterium]|nr:tRNA 2-thiouridine(34) synthase MnmA [Actinomycetota bacterium]